tara:strand:- start:99 stop:491 length:393 start_codon:yes stop_codon:yes gene_type:complete
MKIKKAQLKQIIKEELSVVLNEQDDWYSEEHETLADKKFAEREDTKARFVENELQWLKDTYGVEAKWDLVSTGTGSSEEKLLVWGDNIPDLDDGDAMVFSSVGDAAEVLEDLGLPNPDTKHTGDTHAIGE